jgi:Leucine Rich repeat
VKSPLSTQSLAALLRYSDGRVRSLVVHSLVQAFSGACYTSILALVNVKGFKNHGNTPLLSLFRTLEHLEVKCGWREQGLAPDIRQLIPDTLRRIAFSSPHFSKVNQICIALPQLEHLCCHGSDLTGGTANEALPDFPSMKILELRNIHSENSLDHFLRRLPNLEEFDLENSRGVAQLNLLTPTLKVARIQVSSTHLTVNISSNQLKSLQLSRLRNLFLSIPKQSLLEELVYETISAFDVQILHNFRDSAESLQKLVLASPQFELSDIEYFLRHGRNLRHLGAPSLDCVTDATLSLLHQNQFLESLDVTFCPRITAAGVIQLIKKLCPKLGGRLKRIGFNGESVRRETIDWARSVGVRIVI